MSLIIAKENRKEGEYPFYPTRPEPVVIYTVQPLIIIDEETRQQKVIIDYSLGVSKIFH